MSFALGRRQIGNNANPKSPVLLGLWMTATAIGAAAVSAFTIGASAAVGRSAMKQVLVEKRH